MLSDADVRIGGSGSQLEHRQVMKQRRIVRVETIIVDVPLTFKRATSKGSMGTSGTHDPRVRNPVMVRIEDDEGRVGFGVLRPTNPNYAETTESMASAIHRYYAPALIGADPLALSAVIDRVDKQLLDNPNALAIVDMALHDLAGKILGVPLYTLLGGESADIALDWSVSLGPIEAMVAESKKAVKEYGVHVLSLKVGPSGNWKNDVEKFLAIRKAVGEDVAIGLDANESYDYATAVKLLDALQRDGGGAAYFEQPLNRNSMDELQALRRRTAVPIILDESINTLGEAYRAARSNACDCFVVKISKTGGITRSRRIVAVARAAAIEHTFGGNSQANMLEAACYAHLVAAMPPSDKYAAEFILGLGVVETDPYCRAVDGMVLKEGKVRPPNAPGIGVEIDMEEVTRRAVERHSVH
jgi:L-alanine-DL-glutamate epimerase-like enolase superfamily enzyme